MRAEATALFVAGDRDDDSTLGAFITAAALTGTATDPTVEEALQSAESQQWLTAIDDEYRSLLKNCTWEVEELPPGVKPIPVKWVLKAKRDADGNIERFKARLVAKGFHQREGIDYEETFAPTSRYTTLRVLLATAAELDLELGQLDIKTAFLYGKIDKDIWIEQPPGYEFGGATFGCHLLRSIYGLKQPGTLVAH
ncbi:Retrovirus-related Pol polyprotein from transposon TNT 1-94 [Monoraphidium neglectum]|uniref:Retrovirus-related Pol polyprotein from transposon TNT 1-94 n=1 Tax=Monoraphidium neglectum TaxID=145388 RepID=A0A0D2M7V7_9CHLO|nr:Retrovirus-related Pol polyprotein from transposon TNT 1-94 [Monoraphidium neglectum]KIY99444.1 Retrovirus-related Pol polyprotein from transposon TNT 1-94 [Monoraphidium neglectum]|eukprot:XP_013898464.1 Retrovirus-related Pol polyprotein from transposon TNT 1-94 [Monoraphidium neglectum]